MPASGPTFQLPGSRLGIDQCIPQQRAIDAGKVEFHALTKGHYPGTPIPKNVLPGLNSIGFWDARGDQDWGLDPHRNEGIEIVFLETGKMPFVADGRKHNLRAGHFSITRPWQLHTLGDPHIGPGRVHWLIIDVGVRRPHQAWSWPKWLGLTREDLEELTRRLRHHEQLVWNATPEIASSFREIGLGIASWGRPHAVSELAANLNLLMVRILGVLAAGEWSEDKDLGSHRRTVEMFLADLKAGRIDVSDQWTLERMASYCGMGKSALSKYCVEQVNLGPVEFLNRCRIDLAAQLLVARPAIPITEIALRCGFNSSQYFATSFLKRYQQTPSEFRRTAHS